jgi:hypothetical protein
LTFPGIGFGVSDEFGERLRRYRRIDQHHHRHADDAGDRRDVADEIEVQFFVERGVDRVRDRCQQQRVSVGSGVHDRLGADIAAGAGAVLDHEGLPEMVGQPLADQARGDVDATPGGETGDDFRRPCRIIERGRRLRQDGGGDECAGEFEEIPAKKKFHVERPPVGSKLSQLPRPA